MTTRRALLVVGGVLTALLLAVGTANAVAQVTRQDAVETTALPGGGLSALRVDGDGSVVLRGADVDDLVVEADSEWSFRRPEVTVERDGGSAVVRSDCWRGPVRGCRVRLVVTVPRSWDVTVQTSGGGVVVDDVDGAVDVRSRGGGVTARRLSGGARLATEGGGVRAEELDGPVVLDSRGGSVRATGLRSADVSAESRGGGVRLAFAAPPEQVRVSSRGGGVRLLLPRTPEGYDVRPDSRGGGTDVGVVDDPASSRVVEVSSRGGGVRVEHVG